MTLIWILGATFFVSIISLAGILTLSMQPKTLNKILVYMVGFATGGLLGGAFLHILPESMDEVQHSGNYSTVFLYTLVGFITFFAMERYFHWRHCHDGVCDVHAFAYLNILGDTVHNFVDGLAIAASFVVSTQLGIATTIAIVLHEIPQELGDFGIMVYGGMTKQKALLYNFLSALASVAGALMGYFIAETVTDFSAFLLPFTAGGFIYIASSDLIPEMHKQADNRQANLSFVFMILGIAFMYVSKLFLEHG
jgi:zinc and cadmium transporter